MNKIVDAAREAMVARETPEERYRTLDDCVHEAPNGEDFLKVLLAHTNLPNREIMQCYMVWKYKFNNGISNYDDAFLRFEAEGHAKKFAEVYDGRCKAHTIYERLFNDRRTEVRTNP